MSAGSALVLLCVMFAFAWFGTVGAPGRVLGAGAQSSEDAWSALSLLRWLMLADVLAALGSLALHVTQSAHGTMTRTGPALLTLAAPTGALVIVRVLVDLPDPARVVDAKLGAYLGMLLTLGIALGALSTVREEREAAEAGPGASASRA